MTRSSRPTFLLAVATFFLATHVGLGEGSGAAPLRPNVVFILADNLGFGDVACFGPTVHRTPNIDRLAAEGMRLTSFYSSAPVCTPSRASFMTGCYPRRVGLHTDHNGVQVLMAVSPRGLNPQEITVSEILKGKGYATACIGKWHLGDQPPFLPRNHGFDEFYGLPYSEDMVEGAAGRHHAARPPLPLVENEAVVEAPADHTRLTRQFTERALGFIKANKDRPFFLYLPYPLPGSMKTPLVDEEFRGKSKNGPYGDAVEELDWAVGRVLGALKEHGLDEKTLVLWTSDNGAIGRKGVDSVGSNRPLVGGAYSTDEGGMRMPCIARWPGKIPAGSASDELTTAMDVLPTLARLAGGDVPADRTIDGRDIWPILANQPNARSPHEAFFYYYLHQLQAVRSGKWKLYLPLADKWTSFAGQTTESPARLVDLVEDPTESTNQAAAHPEIVARLTAYAGQARDDLGDLRRPGKGQRPAGHYPNPRPMWLVRVEQRPE